jgi:membrane fusion protein (multidrug efflux system)
MKGKLALAILIVLALAGGLAGIKALQIRKMMAGAKAFVVPPETVSSVVVREENWEDTLTAIGSVTAVQGVNVTPEIAGQVREIPFESGTVVKKGDLLVKLDTSTEEAQLRALESQTELARINLSRAQALIKDKLIPQSELDTAEATVKQAQANADNVRTVIEKKHIRAPFAGVLGIRQVNLGQYLEAGKPIVSLQSLQPIYGHFSLPQQDLGKLAMGMKVNLTTDAYGARVFEGILTAINPDVDASTRSVAVQATFENADRLLRPGMYAKFQVILPQEQKVLVVPATAILSNPYGDSVYVIEPAPAAAGTNSAPGLVVRQQIVRTGRAKGDIVTIQTGLKAGEKVASSGVFKLRNRMAVVENNNLSPKTSETPKPADS